MSGGAEFLLISHIALTSACFNISLSRLIIVNTGTAVCTQFNRSTMLFHNIRSHPFLYLCGLSMYKPFKTP